MKNQKRTNTNKRGPYKFHEVVADIAYQAGVTHYYSGDSREDISQFIAWAHEFEDKHKDTEWDGGEGTDYMIAIEEFTCAKLKEVQGDKENPVQLLRSIVIDVEEMRSPQGDDWFGPFGDGELTIPWPNLSILINKAKQLID